MQNNNTDRSWQENADCRYDYVDTSLFYPSKGVGESEKTEQAQLICSQCVVKEACLEYALENNEEYGIWGGKTESSRRRIRRQRQLARRATGAISA